MTPDENKAIITRMNKEYIEEGNVDIVYELFDNDFVNQTAPPGLPPGQQGIIVFFDHILKPAFHNLKVVIHDQIAEGDQVTTRKSYHATHDGEFFGVPASNKSVIMDIIDIMKLKNGKITDHWGMVDMPGLMAQISTP